MKSKLYHQTGDCSPLTLLYMFVGETGSQLRFYDIRESIRKMEIVFHNLLYAQLINSNIATETNKPNHITVRATFYRCRVLL